jgi:single-stranded-DNA-specific exonuclease
VGLPASLCELLVRRGFKPNQSTRRFLRPSFTDLHDPLKLVDLSTATERVECAIRDGETVLVHGDYDADGMTATALLTLGLRHVGLRAVPFVPDRSRDGYDLGPSGIEEARAQGATLIVTADCGIKATGAVEDAASIGIDVVITDHHQPGAILPPAVAVINPNRENQEYPFRDLAGVGVAFKLIQQLFIMKEVSDQHLNQYLDLVALGTIADQAVLVGENRALTRFGLRVLNHSRRPGIQALCRAANVGKWSKPRATDIAFRLAPRLNSAGRIGEARDGARLLMSSDRAEADSLVRVIEDNNTARRKLDSWVLEKVHERISDEFDVEKDMALVMWGNDWHPGVLGIVAGRIAEEIHCPVLLIGMEGDRGRGSARSIPGFNVLEALTSCSDLFERFGGHAAAAGFDVRRDQLAALRSAIISYAAGVLGSKPHKPGLRVEQELPIREVTTEVAQGLIYLEPFGRGNPIPRFHARNVRVQAVEMIGERKQHARMRLVDGREGLDAIAFGRPDLATVADGRPRDIVYELHVEEKKQGLRSQAHVLGLREA